MLVVVATACAGSSVTPSGFEGVGPGEPSTITALMLRHYDRARVLTSAAIFGDVERARSAATAILREDPADGLPAALSSERREFLASVRSVERASDRTSLAATSADVALRCGDCHLAAGLGPSFSVGRVADPVTPEDHIRVLAWGSSRMWEGMVGGSELSWRAGARALSGQLLREDLYVPRMENPEEGRALGARLHALGVEALAASDRPEQARILGEIWGTCSRCHELIDTD